MTADLPSPELLRKLLRYEPETGKLFWRERMPDMFRYGKQTANHNCRRWNSRFAGTEALTAVDRGGYRHGDIFGRKVKAHRVAYAIYYGTWPENEIDHIDGVCDNNRIVNLRAATSTDNKRNQKLSSKNTSGVVGVSWHNPTRKWRAYINDATGRKYLGLFTAKAEAISARKVAEIHFGYHENHGRIE